MAILPLTDEQLIRKGLKLIPITPQGATGDMTYQIPLPDFAYTPFDWGRRIIRWVCEIFPYPGTAGAQGQAPEPVPAPEPAPEGAEAGGGMAYHRKVRFFPKTGEKVYRWLKDKAESEGYFVRELRQQDIGHYYRSRKSLQGYEKPTGDGHEIGVMAYDRDGSKVSKWKQARILGHEYVGAKYFTRRGKPHEANHGKIESMADRLLDELALAAA